MAESFRTRLQHAWNAFSNQETTDYRYSTSVGSSYGYRPDRVGISIGSERTIINAIYNRIAVDVAATTFMHVRVDENKRYKEEINSGLNYCLNEEANIDQTATAFMADIAYSLLEEGCIAIVPIDTTLDPFVTGSYDINSMRRGKIVGWHPKHVDLEVYNDNSGIKQQITMPKSSVAIIENPFYAVMNEPNSTLKRLVYKLKLLDDADAKANSSKLDAIVQLPYTIRNESQKKRAEDRKRSLEDQLENSKYGVAYIDATEKFTQLNRSVENTLPEQIKTLTDQLYSQLSLDITVLNGTATDSTMNNYYQRTVAPVVKAIRDAMNCKFLTKTARTQNQQIMTFQDPFKYMTVTQISQMVDSLSRNEVLTGNEFRTALGFKPSEEPSADELRNKNLIDPNADYGSSSDEGYNEYYYPDDASDVENQNGSYQ